MSVKNGVLAHHFADLDQQHDAARLGMWAFLATEVMVFAVLFTGYTVYRWANPAEFEAASNRLSLPIAAINTIVLLTSSLTMALAVYGAQTNRRNLLLTCLLLTAAFGAAFLGIKAYEYYHDYEQNLVPRLAFNESEWQIERSDGTSLSPQRVQLFLMFYYIMTGLHAIHLIIGIGVILVIAFLAWRGRFSPVYYAPVEVSGLYWHFVDVIWVFLLPLLYLIGERTSL